MTLAIHPSVGIARLGNSLQDDFCLSPTTIGGLPTELDGTPVTSFKNSAGCIRRQGQLFKIYDETTGDEINLASPGVKSIVWTVHLANKKAAWYQYSELQGNLLYGPENSYEATGVPLRNNTQADRRSLIVDPGPRSISGESSPLIELDKNGAPAGYPVSFPNENPTSGSAIKSLGSITTDPHGNLIALGGYGNAGGDEPLTNYGGSDTWHDDTSDGAIYCTVTHDDGKFEVLKAWLVVGSPDFAPEIVNISSLDDTFFDVGIRALGLNTDIYANGQYQSDFIANYKRDILPIIERISNYQWVANVQSMSGFFSYQFDFSDNSEENAENRQRYYQYFRQADAKTAAAGPQDQLFSEFNGGQLPMMPMNSGSNSVSNETIEKFLALDQTQLFLLGQWAAGKFTNDAGAIQNGVNPLDKASVGNCVGLPMCPGIEVTWSLQNPVVYAAPYQILHDQSTDYQTDGLTPSRDECEGGGCQPGDLTKRMACPWQADFFQCTIQNINFTDSAVNKAYKTVTNVEITTEKWQLDGQALGNTLNAELTQVTQTSEPLTPSYYSYWWPPQSPWDVITGEVTQQGQADNHLAAGQQMNYQRGINSFTQMVEHWSALAFIRDRNAVNQGFPYFTETERNNEIFEYQEIQTGQITGNSVDNEVTIPVFSINADRKSLRNKSDKGLKMAEYFEQRAFKPIKVVDRGLDVPRSGTRMRR